MITPLLAHITVMPMAAVPVLPIFSNDPAQHGIRKQN
jgi:hypothetical protein